MPVMYRSRWPVSDAENTNFAGDGAADYRHLSSAAASDSVVWSLSALSLRSQTAEPGGSSCQREELLLSSHGGASIGSSISQDVAHSRTGATQSSETGINFPASAPLVVVATSTALGSSKEDWDGEDRRASADYIPVAMAASSAADVWIASTKKQWGGQVRASAPLNHLSVAMAASSDASAAADLWMASKNMKKKQWGEEDWVSATADDLPIAMAANSNASSSANPSMVSSSTMFSAHSSSSSSRVPADRSHARACLSTSWSSGFCMLDVVDEDQPWEEPSQQEQPDSASASASSTSSSLLSLSMENDCAEMEVQSSYRDGGASELSASLGASSSSPRKGLSRFYSGKSRSFSCLGDVVSLKDIVKPENPYAKKRKHNLSGTNSLDRPPRLPPLQKGTASISKKAVHNGGKAKLALGVALTSVQDSSPWVQSQQQRLMVSRSYSLTDLQGVAGSHSSV